MSVDAPYTVLGPSAPPSGPSSGPGNVGAVRLLFCEAMLRVSPPWLRRFVGGVIMKSLGIPVDGEVDRNVEGVETRFPLGRDGATIHEEALGLLGRERRILRGPGELDATFAVRLRKWWDAHRTRGSAQALLTQLHDFFLATNNVPIVYIANSGTASARVDVDGVITRPEPVSPGWVGDGENPPQWARFFLFFELDDETFEVPVVTEDGEPVLTEAGETVLASISIYALTAAELEVICSVPLEWSAAHIDRIYIDLLPFDGIAWGYPPTLEWGDPGRTWGGDLAVQIVC